MKPMIVHARISENVLAQAGVSADELAKAIQSAIQNLTHPSSGGQLVWPSPIHVTVEGDGADMRWY